MVRRLCTLGPRHDPHRVASGLGCWNARCSNTSKPFEELLSTAPCMGCGLVRYCSRACQAQHWPVHRRLCSMAAKRHEEEADVPPRMVFCDADRRVISIEATMQATNAAGYMQAACCAVVVPRLLDTQPMVSDVTLDVTLAPGISQQAIVDAVLACGPEVRPRINVALVTVAHKAGHAGAAAKLHFCEALCGLQQLDFVGERLVLQPDAFQQVPAPDLMLRSGCVAGLQHAGLFQPIAHRLRRLELDVDAADGGSWSLPALLAPLTGLTELSVRTSFQRAGVASATGAATLVAAVRRMPGLDSLCMRDCDDVGMDERAVHEMTKTMANTIETR